MFMPKQGNRLAWIATSCSAVMALLVQSVTATAGDVTMIHQDDFKYGTYIIDQPGRYRLAEDISFNPNSPATLTAAVEDGVIDAATAAGLGLSTPVDAFHAGFPLPMQYTPMATEPFVPGGPMDPRYDPAGFGLGFFAAIVIMADDVTLDLAGHTLEQSAEHALLQRFYANIELAEQPFIPAQGPADFGSEIISANNVVIKNGTIGRSSHHGIHGNGNDRVRIEDVDFVDYEVGAVALNGATNLVIANSTAVNRKDVPVLGTFSSVQFLKPYVAYLARSGSTTVLNVGGTDLTAADILAAMQDAVNNVHSDVIVEQFSPDGRAQINPATHPAEYALFHNKFGIVDGNSYSFLVNRLGVAVNGFPFRPAADSGLGAENIWISRVNVKDQRAFINEIVAINQGGNAVIDPVGAVFQTRNLNPADGSPVTVSDLDPAQAMYVGNVAANAQAFVGKAILNGDFAGSFLDTSRNNITEAVLNWVEAKPGFETVSSLVGDGTGFLCNGDSMFHVNKGVIAFKLDAAKNVWVTKSKVTGLENLGDLGDTICGDYGNGKSHPAAAMLGYGGARTRAFSLAGSEHVLITNSAASGLVAATGSAIGVDVINDSTDIHIRKTEFSDIEAGYEAGGAFGGPNEEAYAAGVVIRESVTNANIAKFCSTMMSGFGGEYVVEDLSGDASLKKICQ